MDLPIGTPVKALPVVRPRRIQCQRKLQQRQPMDGALLVAASIVAAIRLRGQEITRSSPKLVAVVSDSVLLVRTVMAALEPDR
ncbi:MAG TPA: hypothetical protein VE133_15800 [Candidatus Sulfotelmatobacter sp.]|nr:hypothetical protein [Candidatus Sulfotelmatobacter sp.]